MLIFAGRMRQAQKRFQTLKLTRADATFANIYNHDSHVVYAKVATEQVRACDAIKVF